MAVADAKSISSQAGERPSSVQPGGGLFVRLELAWGRVRRAYLRRLRPGYVERMRLRRQGECPNCVHEVIDARDLKYCRNVCGYFFQPEDDPFAWRGRLGLARHGWIEILCFSAMFAALASVLAAAAILVHWVFWLLAAVAIFFWVQAVYFFRDPERVITNDPRALIAPADGTVTHVDKVEDPDFPAGQALRISIFLSVFNVHVNRAPRGGRIIGIRYFRGDFLDARNQYCATRNEQLWVDIEEPGGRRLRVKQIAGAVARRIVCWLKPGEEIRAGERIGMIKFGSRTDILLPLDPAIELLVKVGDQVSGGSSVLLRLGPAGVQ